MDSLSGDALIAKADEIAVSPTSTTAASDPTRLGQVAEPKQTQLRAKYLKAYAALGREDLVQ
jgi:hypothetical protein